MALLLTLIAGSVSAQATPSGSRQATPAAASEDLAALAAAAPADATAFVAVNLDPASAQFQTSAELSGAAGLIDLFLFATEPSESDLDEADDFYDQLGATTVAVAVPPVDTSTLEPAIEASSVDPVADDTPGRSRRSRDQRPGERI